MVSKICSLKYLLIKAKMLGKKVLKVDAYLKRNYDVQLVDKYHIRLWFADCPFLFILRDGYCYNFISEFSHNDSWIAEVCYDTFDFDKI
jgi:hypothetical protein